MSTAALPADTSAPLVLFCRSGRRASAAQAWLQTRGYTAVLNAGGPAGPQEQMSAFGHLVHNHKLGIFMQLFDGLDGGGSSTYTYVLGDEASREALVIDPVKEHAERDLKLIDEYYNENGLQDLLSNNGRAYDLNI